MNALDKVGLLAYRSGDGLAERAGRHRSRCVRGELRRGDGGAAILMGSANLAGTLSAHGLIDEYRFAVNPVLLGGGTPVARAGSARSELDLADTRVFGSGIVEMRCIPR